MSLRHLIQPNKSTCGQACVAMAAGISIEQAIALCGHRDTTRSEELARMLRRLGFLTRRVSAERALPARAICKVRYRKKSGFRKKGHWVLLWDGKRYDPLAPEITAVIDIGKRRRVRG